MAKQAHILSIDEAKRSTGASRYVGRSTRPTSQPSYIDSADAYSPRRRNAAIATAAVDAGKRATVRSTRSVRPVVQTNARSSKPNSKRAVRAQDVARSASSTRSTGSARSASPARSAGSRFAVATKAPVSSAAYENAPAAEVAESAKATRITKAEARKRAKAKKRADKKFVKEFGALDEARNQAAAANGQATPRAAVYKTQMGASQKKANRMQQSAAQAAGAVSSKVSFLQALNPMLLLEHISHSTKAIVGVAAAACLVFTCVFLYPTAQTYYQAARENDRLQAEYDALLDRNSQLEASVSSLQSTAGIEAKAHDQLGWVKSGEVSVNVNGLDVDSTSASSSSSSLVAAVDTSTIDYPSTWYSPLLDLIFGV